MPEAPSKEEARAAVKDHYSGFVVAGQADGTRAAYVQSIKEVTTNHFRYTVINRSNGVEEGKKTGTVYREDGEWHVNED